MNLYNKVVRKIFSSKNKLEYKKKNINISRKAKVNINCNFEGYNTIGSNTILNNTSVGYGSYLGENCYLPNTDIGKFCSVGNSVKLISGIHPTNFVSTHPAFYSVNSKINLVGKQKFEEHKYIDNQRQLMIKIENDVWIGENVSIFEGVTIKNGTIIGANALVNKDLEPYGIYVGIPAKKIGSRFDDDQIRFLLNLKWWEKPTKWIEENADNFDDIRKIMYSTFD